MPYRGDSITCSTPPIVKRWNVGVQEDRSHFWIVEEKDMSEEDDKQRNTRGLVTSKLFPTWFRLRLSLFEKFRMVVQKYTLNLKGELPKSFDAFLSYLNRLKSVDSFVHWFVGWRWHCIDYSLCLLAFNLNHFRLQSVPPMMRKVEDRSIVLCNGFSTVWALFQYFFCAPWWRGCWSRQRGRGVPSTAFNSVLWRVASFSRDTWLFGRLNKSQFQIIHIYSY